MPKTSKITFNVNDLQRQHTGQKRCYDNIGLARLINSPQVQERVSKGDLIGYYGHWPRKKFGMQPHRVQQNTTSSIYVGGILFASGVITDPPLV